MPALDDIIAAAHARGVPVFVAAGQLAPHRGLPAGADFLAWSGHKMYAPFGAGALVDPRRAFCDGDPFLAGGGAVDLVDFDEVTWTDPPEREEAGSPNVIGAIAVHAAIEEFERFGLPAIEQHHDEIAYRLRGGLAAIDKVRVLGPSLDTSTLPVATLVVEGIPHALVAALLSAEHGIGVRHGCFCAHPYCFVCSGCLMTRCTPTGRPCVAATGARCPAPFAPAARSRRAPPISIDSSRPSTTSPTDRPRP
jgi:selenocysteine lyase/cysteine desulfurase